MVEKTDGKQDEEGRPLTGHSYDGIEELDNSLPRWWLYTLYGTILFSVGYFAYYVVGEGPTLVKEYEHEKYQIEVADLSKANLVKVASENELRELLKNKDNINSGKSIFEVKCVSCHGSRGEGGIGPNLTDDYWIHGGKMTEIVQTITQGVLDKGMPAWGSILKQDEIHFVSAYIKSLRGTHPPNSKGPQGDLVRE